MGVQRLVASAMAGLAMSLVCGWASGAAAARATATVRSVAPTRCSADHGTLVAVDFAHWGGPIVRGCAVRARTAADALHAIGFETAGDAHDGPGFICRLGDPAFRHGSLFPTAGQQDCVDTPAASGYWSSWLTSAGATRFRYSQLGVMDEPARPGETLLWTFGATNIAGTSGAAVPRFTANALHSTPAASVRVVDAVTARSSQHSSGSPFPSLSVIAIAVALGVVAYSTSRRRRREQ